VSETSETSFLCEVLVTVGEFGTFAHQGTLISQEGQFLDGKLVITGGFDCYEGIVGSTSIGAMDPPDEMVWDLDVKVDARLW
jgi:hypothetical protein